MEDAVTMLTKNNKIKNLLLSLIGICLLVIGWIVISSRRPDLFATPAATWERFLLLLEKPISRVSLAGHILISMERVFAGLIAAWILGIAFGVLIGWNKTANALFGSVFEIIRPIPPLAWIPLITIWFGIGEIPKIIIVFIGTFATIVLNASAGIKFVDPLYLDVGRIWGASNRQLLREIAIPAAFPALFAAKTAIQPAPAGWQF
jgi:taurine transport system permease protein